MDVYNASSTNAAAASAPAQQPAANINAPVTNITTQTTKNISKSPLKNQEPSINSFFSGRQRFNS